jgi:hypothetical protein
VVIAIWDSGVDPTLFRMAMPVAEVRRLILDGADRNGRINLIHPRRTLELAAALKPDGPKPADVTTRR